MGRAGGRVNRLPGLSLGMESAGERRRGSRVGLQMVLDCSLLHVSLAIQLSHRQMSFQLALLIRTSVQHSVWKMDKMLVVEVGPQALGEAGEMEEVMVAEAALVQEDLEVLEVLEDLVVMEAPVQMVVSEEETEVVEAGEETEEVVVMEEEVERVLSEVLEELEELAVLALMPIVPGTGPEVVTGGRVADVARVVAVDQKQERRKVGQEKHKSQ